MDTILPLSEFRQMAVQEFDTSKLLKHAASQARQRGYGGFPIVDVDSHHFETESFAQIFDYIEDPVIQQLCRSTSLSARSGGVLPGNMGNQDMGGRVTRYVLRRMEKGTGDVHRDVTLTRRWMDAMGVDIAILFPTPMLSLGMHPEVDMEVALARAYNRWLVETVLEVEPRIRSMLYLPFNDPDATYRMVEEFGDRKGVVGFMVTAARYNKPVYHNDYMKTYAALEERGLPLGFHAAYDWREQSMVNMNRFISVHAIGFVLHNLIHLTNWVINGLPERFPRLKLLWIESGLAWIPFIMQRLDNEYMMRTSEAPALKRLPSEYIQDMFFTSQPMERPRDQSLLEATFRAIKAESQLLYSSDYPHWDFDLPSTIYDLPFLDEAAKRAILGGNALRLFGLEAPATKLARMG